MPNKRPRKRNTERSTRSSKSDSIMAAKEGSMELLEGKITRSRALYHLEGGHAEDPLARESGEVCSKGYKEIETGLHAE